MLTADELEALLNSAREMRAVARRAFGDGSQTAAETEADRRGDEWWEKHLRQMREQEAQRER